MSDPVLKAETDLSVLRQEFDRLEFEKRRLKLHIAGINNELDIMLSRADNLREALDKARADRDRLLGKTKEVDKA